MHPMLINNIIFNTTDYQDALSVETVGEKNDKNIDKTQDINLKMPRRPSNTYPAENMKIE